MGQCFNLVPQQVWPVSATPTMPSSSQQLPSCEITVLSIYSYEPNSPIHTCTQPSCPNLSFMTLQVRNQLRKIKGRKVVDSWSPELDVGFLSICSTKIWSWGEFSACGRHIVLYLSFSTPRTPAATDQSLLYPIKWRYWSNLLNLPGCIHFWAHPRRHFSFYTGLMRMDAYCPPSSYSSVGLFLTWRRMGAMGGSSYRILNARCTIFWKFPVTRHFFTQQYWSKYSWCSLSAVVLQHSNFHTVKWFKRKCLHGCKKIF